jgi:hypothetical protein
MNTVKRGGWSPYPTTARPKIFQRNLKNPLDKIPNLWYNEYVIKREKSP